MIPLAALIIVVLGATAQAAPGVCRAIDGDTYVCHGERVRVENIDAPELHGRCANEFDAARAARLFAQHALDGALLVEIKIHERRPRDRYGDRTARPE